MSASAFFGVMLLAFAIVVGIPLLLQQMMRDRAKGAARKIVQQHIKALARHRSQKLTIDDYGKTVDRGWKKEANYFITTQLPIEVRKHIGPQDIDRFVVEAIQSAPQDAEGTSFDRRYAEVKTGHDFEHFVKDELSELGWTVQHTGRSGDQGADLIAAMGDYRVAVQCKFYSRPINNQAVQEVVAAQKYYGAQAAIIVSNQPLNKSGAALAKSNDVMHFFHDDLMAFWAVYKIEADQYNALQA